VWYKFCAWFSAWRSVDTCQTKGEEQLKCIVKDCENHTHEGGFVGDLCSPCHEFITTGQGVCSQAYRNTKREWVGLTDEEIRQLWHSWLDGDASTDWAFERSIEARLKEKNT